MQKSELLAALQSEIRRHNFSTFYKKGVVVPGCPPCGKRLNTRGQFIDYLAEGVAWLAGSAIVSNRYLRK
jgi:hypothetical protein